ncbi:MAG: ABC transporter permease [Gammaproteobacteria bacterium]|nr:ABC transporter permease [Gammaproteobacteria bacterium]
MQTIEVAKLALVLIPALLVVLIQWQWSLKAGTSVYALARMVIQLCLIGYVLTYIFTSEHSALVLLVLSVMVLVSSWISLRTVVDQRRRLYGCAILATLCVNGLLLALITQLVLHSDPWYSPQIVIPLAGMVFAAGMNAISLFAERYYSELAVSTEAEQGGPSEQDARNTAYHATLIPTINSLFAVGLVSLPGMMTGQILSGVSPLIAVRYQIMIMLMLFASSGLTTALFYKLLRWKQT